MARFFEKKPAQRLAEHLVPLSGDSGDFDPLLEMAGAKRFVLLGEATHGTHEFYRMRAEITKRLIREKGFNAVAIEGDWPDAYRVNRLVRGMDPELEAADALEGFKRFPAWMWRNADMLDFIGWLREHNESMPPAGRAGFYGMDLYSLYPSIQAVIGYLDRVDPEAAGQARGRYSCFEVFGEDPQSYSLANRFGISRSCEEAALEQLLELSRKSMAYLERGGALADEEYFCALQNARLVKNAEAYYRTLFKGSVSSWNLRDLHMVETLESLIDHLEKKFARPKIAVWAHNSHVGDAGATQMGEAGEWNVGQLMRQRYGGDVLILGFTTYRGSVTAASSWGGSAERHKIRPGLPGSYETLFHRTGVPRFMLDLGRQGVGELIGERLERAIGVLYFPESERYSHYFDARMHRQFDAVIHCDETRAVEPLERVAESPQRFPETYPSGV